MEGRTVSDDGVHIHFDFVGTGTPSLVFVHGWSCDRTYWKKQVPHFAAKHAVVTVDLAGHGDSGRNRRSWSMEGFGLDVVAVVEQLDLEEVVLIGHSMAGWVIVEAAQRIPHRLVGVMAVDTFYDLAPVSRTDQEVSEFLDPFRQDFERAVSDFVRTTQFVPTSDPALVEDVVNDMASAPPEVAISAFEHLLHHDEQLRKGLESIQVPFALIQSDHHPTNITAVREYGIEVEMMSGVSHFLMLEAADRFNGVVEAKLETFLRKN